MGTQGKGNIHREDADTMFVDLCDILDQFNIEEAIPCGSFRRGKEHVNDLDVVVVTENGELPAGLKEELAKEYRIGSFGKKQACMFTPDNEQIDLNSCNPAQRGSFVLHWTGSAAHNVYLRKLAMKKGLSLSQYGLKDKKNGTLFTGPDEECIFMELGIDFVPPEERG